MKKTKWFDPNTLYNLIFPLFMLYLLSPLLWVVMIIGNFLIDSLVVLIASRKITKKKEQVKKIWKTSILKVVIFGFLSDLMGSLTTTVLAFAIGWFAPTEWTVWGGFLDIYSYPGALIYALPAILIAGWMIYVLNKRWSFNKAGISTKNKKGLALCLAIFTAPYFMLLPTTLFW